MSLFSSFLRLFRPSRANAPARASTAASQAVPPRAGTPSTVEVPLPGRGGVTIGYAPRRNGTPDAGEIVWAWVPYQEDPSQGKDRPLLVIARHGSDRAYALKLTSTSHDGDRDYLSIGSGPWDSKGRASWVDIDQLYSVHTAGIRREASALDADTFRRVAAVLVRRYGWTAGS